MKDDPFGAGDKLRKLREFHNYTQEYVATELGVAPNTLSDYEKGKLRVNRETLEKAARLFAVDVNMFFTQEPLIITLHNNQLANGYVEAQHNVDKDLLDRMFTHVHERDKRMEELPSLAIERLGGKSA